MTANISVAIAAYNQTHSEEDQRICMLLAEQITKRMPEGESKIWHGHPVWFLSGNPIVGYSKQKGGIRLMFWSGADFQEENLNVHGGKFKDASIFYNLVDHIDTEDLKRWIEKSKVIQWDYKNLVKKKGILERLI